MANIGEASLRHKAAFAAPIGLQSVWTRPYGRAYEAEPRPGRKLATCDSQASISLENLPRIAILGF